MHPALGGLDTTKAPTLLEPDQLTQATNIEYFTSGARKKRLGTARYNASAVSGTPTFTALFDYWRHGTGLVPTQKFVAIAGDEILKDDGDGVWDSLLTGFGTSTARAHIMLAQGYAVFSHDAGQRPRKWDQTTVTLLSPATDYRYEAAVYHLRRLFTVGEQVAITGDANPSRSQVTAAGDITDFSGGDTTSLIFDDDDGDRLVGVSQPFRNRLFFFKGPNFGSVYELTGSTLATLARNKVITGAPCVSHAGIITTPNDIFWASRYGFHSLQATQKFGDTEEAFVSRPIQSLFNDVSQSRLPYIRGFYHPTRNIVGWAVSGGGQSQNNLVFVYNFIQAKWAVWEHSGFNAASVAVMQDPQTLQPRTYWGGYDGFVYEGDQTTQTDANGSAYTATIETPRYVRLGEAATELHEKSFYGVTTYFKPKGAYNLNLDITCDGRTQSFTIDQAGGGAALDDFELNVDRLGGGELTYAHTPYSDRGVSIQLQYTNSGSNQDMEIYGYAIRAHVAEGMGQDGTGF